MQMYNVFFPLLPKEYEKCGKYPLLPKEYGRGRKDPNGRKGYRNRLADRMRCRKWQTKNIAAGPDDRWAAMRCDEIYEILWLVSEDFEAHGLAGEGKGGGG